MPRTGLWPETGRGAGTATGWQKRLLDVGGGSGIYASTLLAAQPQMTGAVLEQSPVDAIAREEIAQHGLANRLEVLNRYV